MTAEDVARLMPFYEAGREGGGSFDQGIEQVVAAVLASPDFLYRAIRGPQGTSPNGEFALTDLELASRLSFFLWNTGPDDELLTLAAAGGLTKPGALEKQVRRMLADPKASSLVTSFAMKWLNLTTLDSVQPDPKLFPGFSEQLRHDFAKEAEAFVSSILLEDRSVVDLLTSNHTFLNERVGSPLRRPRGCRPPVPRGHADRKRARRPAGQGGGAAADFVWRPHVSRIARSVGARQAAGHAPDASAGRTPQPTFLKRPARRRRPSARGWSSIATRRAATSATV